MSLHSYTRVWLHLVWATLERRPLLTEAAAVKLSDYLHQYSREKGFYMKINYVNADHTHALVELPTAASIEDMMHLFKGASSHWINENNLGRGKFAWGRGYDAFSVSQSGIGSVAKYIAQQKEHHRRRSFAEELRLLVERHGLKWEGKETVKTVSPHSEAS
jgi:putative transposase